MSELLIVTHGKKNTASTRYRILNILPFIEKRGMTYEIVKSKQVFTGISQIDNAINEYVNIPYKSKKNKKVLIQKRLLNKSTVKSISKSCTLLYDFDDAIYTAPPWDKSSSRKQREKLNYTLSLCDKTIVGSKKLKRYAEDYCSNVKVIPTPVKRKGSKIPSTTSKSDKLTVGWIGHPSNLWYLHNVLHEIDIAFSKAKKKAELKIVSKYDESFKKVFKKDFVNFVEWSLESEKEEIKSFDVVLRPLVNDEWSTSKGGFTSVVECLSYGIPVIASKVEGIEDIITDGKSGFLIDDAREWKDIFGKLKKANIELHNMGKKAVEEVGKNNLWLHQRGDEMAKFICQ